MAVGAWKGSGGIPAGGSAGQVLTRDSGTGVEWTTPSGTGDMLSTANLSDLANAGTARTNLGVAIGTNVQAYNANLTTYATVAPTAAGLALLDDANAAAQRTTLGLGTAAVAATGDFDAAGTGATEAAAAVATHTALTDTAHGITAFGSSLTTAADAAAAITALGLGTAALEAATAFQVADTTLTALASGSSGIARLTSASAATYHAVGVTNATDLLQLSDADTRYLRVVTSMPGAGVGANGDRAVLVMSGYPGVIILKTAGTWAVESNDLTFAQMLSIASPAAGMLVNVSTITFAGDAGTQTISAPFRYSGTEWRPVYQTSLIFAANTTNIPNSSTGWLNLYTFGFPASLIYAGALFELDIWLRSSNTADADTALFLLRKHDASTVLATLVNASTVGHSRVEVHGFGSAADVITWPGDTSAGSHYTGAGNTVSSVASDTANGSNLHRIGFTGSAADSSKSWDIEFMKLTMKP